MPRDVQSLPTDAPAGTADIAVLATATAAVTGALTAPCAAYATHAGTDC